MVETKVEKIYRIKKFWDDEYKHLEYHKEPFNNKEMIEKWRHEGYMNDTKYFTGQMCPFSKTQPSWNDKFIEWAESKGLKDVGCCYYRMETGVILPLHKDTYNVYRKKFNCELKDIKRIIVFLEDWKSGHYFELDGKPLVGYKEGTYSEWNGDVEHMAANIGVDYRYTLQITGRS
jgi:hypothetical protein